MGFGRAPPRLCVPSGADSGRIWSQPFRAGGEFPRSVSQESNIEVSASGSLSQIIVEAANACGGGLFVASIGGGEFILKFEAGNNRKSPGSPPAVLLG